MKRFGVGLIAAAVAAIGFGGVSAFASTNNNGNDNGYNPPPQTLTVCDAGHGAFGLFSHNFAFDGGINWIAAAAQADGGIGSATGPANSGLGQACIGTNP